jgi:hypothetical protein
MDADTGLAQQNFTARCSVIDRDAAFAVCANQKLVTVFVRVLSADLPRWNSANDKIAL